jgi:hypothetical protein
MTAPTKTAAEVHRRVGLLAGELVPRQGELEAQQALLAVLDALKRDILATIEEAKKGGER